MAESETLLELDGVCAGYGRMQVLWDVHLGLKENESVVVLGANGAGKTTLLRVILGLLPLMSGTLSFAGQRMEKLKTENRVKLGIAYMTELGIFPSLGVEENLLLGGWRIGRKTAKKALGEVYESFPDLASRRRTPAGSLSGGQRKMVGVAKALMSQPRLLVMDEPSSGLSPLFVKEVIDRLNKVRDGGTALLVAEQNVAFLNTARRAYVLEGGHVRFDGSVSAFEDDEALHEAFFGLEA